MPVATFAFVAVALVGLLPLRQEAEPADVRAAVERFFATQEAEDVEGYMALWSTTAQRPDRKQLQYIFDSGADKFSDITLVKVIPMGDRVRVRVSVTRARTDTRTLAPDGTPRTFNSRLTTSLTFVREADGLKLLSERSPSDDLALALIAAATPAERDQLLAAEADLANDRLTYAMARRADALAQALKYQEAGQLYERVIEIARRIGDRRGEGEAFHNLGNTQYFRRDFAAALRSYEQRLGIERQIENDAGIAAALLGIATVRYSTFEYGAALAAYREALTVYESLDDEVGIATTLVSTGNVLYLQGDYDSAIADYQRSRVLHRKTLNFGGEARALEGLGRTLAAQGDLAGALDAFAGVLKEATARRVRSMQATATQSIGDAHFRLGNLDAARAAFEESRGHFEAEKDLEGVGRLWQALALTDLVATRFAAAEKEYGESGAACTAAGDAECVARAIIGLAFAQAAQEKFDPAIASYVRGIEAFTNIGRIVEAARGEVGLSQALFGKEDYAAALAAAGRARDVAIKQQHDDVLWRAHVAEARALRRMKSPDKAAQAASSAVAAVRRMWDAARERPTTRVPADSTAAFVIQAVLQAEAGDAAGALVTLEERNAHALRVALSPVEREIARGMTAEERSDERAAAVELVSLHVRLEQEKGLPKPDAARIANLQEQIGPAISRRTALEQRLYDRLPALRVWRGHAPIASLAQIASLAGDREALASFALDEHDLLLVTMTRRDDGTPDIRAHVTAVKRQKVAELIAVATAPAAMRDVAEWRRTAADVANLLPADALGRLAAASRVVVVPDDVLWRVPFEALPWKEGTIGDTTGVTYAGSFTSLIIPQEARDERPVTPLVAAAAPSLPVEVRDRVKATTPGWTLRAPEDAQAEIEHAAAAFDEGAVVTITGDSASEAAFRTQAPAAMSLHVAVPFRMNGASPVFSPMLWTSSTPAAGTVLPFDDDGVVQARDVMNMDLRARAVVLSDPAATSMRDGAAAAPVVAWAWRAAGVPVLLVPRWPVDATIQQDFFAGFYERIRKGDPAGTAFQSAVARLRAREATRAPAAWAAWIIVGK